MEENEFYENDFFQNENFNIVKDELLTNFNINENEFNEEYEKENYYNKGKENLKNNLIQRENGDDNISTSIEKKNIDKKELRKIKNKESARKCRLKKKLEFNQILEENQKLKNELCYLRKKLSTHLCSECKEKILNLQTENYSNSPKNDFHISYDRKSFLNKKRSCVIFTAVTIFFCFFFNFSIPFKDQISLRKLSNNLYSLNKFYKRNLTYHHNIIDNIHQGIFIKNGNEEIEGDIFKMKKLYVLDLKKLYRNEERKNRRDKFYLTNEKLKKIRLCFEFEPFWKEIDKEGESGIGMELINNKMNLFE